MVRVGSIQNLLLWKIKYSIVYAVIRPEIAEQISVGMLNISGNDISFKYSRNKLKLLKSIYSQKEYAFYSKVIRSMKSKTIESVNDVFYLIRYSNNMLAMSDVKEVDMPPTNDSLRKLYELYVYRSN